MIRDLYLPNSIALQEYLKFHMKWGNLREIMNKIRLIEHGLLPMDYLSVFV